MKNSIFLAFVSLLLFASANAQSAALNAAAKEIIQPSQSAAANFPAAWREITIPAGTPIEIEAAYTVNSLDVKPGERISFRVVIPVMVNGAMVIENGALVTARVTRAKRGGHWGKGGRLVWSMEDVVAADNTRVLLAPETASRDEKLWNLEAPKTAGQPVARQGTVKGTSHTGEVAAMSIVAGALFPPLALMNGFKRGENAILREGRRFVVAVGKDTVVKGLARP